MPKEEWGVKRICPTTGKRFYDLGRSPVVSPYTGDVVPLDTGKGSRVLIREEKEPVKPAKKPETEEAALIDDEEDALEVEADVDLGDEVLDDDDDSDTVSLDDIADIGGDDDDS